MGMKLLLTALLLTGVLTSTGVAAPQDKRLKDEAKAAKAESKAERKAVPVPEPSVMLLTAIGMGSLALFGYWRDRSSRRPNQ